MILASRWYNKDFNKKDTVRYVQGYFVWCDGEVSVSNVSVGYNYLSNNLTIL